MVQEEELLALPRDELQKEGTGTKVAYGLMTNELLLDGSARFIQTEWLESIEAAMPKRRAGERESFRH